MVAGSEINLNNLHDHGADGKVWYIGTTSQVLEPVTQPRKTNTPRCPDFSDLANNILGTVKQFVQGFADATLDNLSMGVLSPEPAQWTTSYKAGRLAGDVVGMADGILGMAAGAGMTGGGSAVSVGSYNVNPKNGKKYFNGYNYRPARADEIPSDYVKK